MIKSYPAIRALLQLSRDAFFAIETKMLKCVRERKRGEYGFLTLVTYKPILFTCSLYNYKNSSSKRYRWSKSIREMKKEICSELNS